ncbi:N-acetylmuramoyl-L-alanine amidase [[Clostridium] hylemonae]|uniref:N-acetylmuramoyl-L-alanine amidase n=1 Tax=[Clostridium] hylemonae DSM 15053 TaxID=553973 RepID=C0BXB3_9FIRM|nr:peptidoglycan-binding domain-containing protein [[Clostridium] hylemonae]EEG75440.1 N-acetylmuramoyl-L-alanine amidase [[Clostridium] hylemonae DSM 15053]QEK18056.1 N-acetylmuramoyl-L-alanine amidase CwlA [[Clostridium] hylemonae DSM 15053]
MNINIKETNLSFGSLSRRSTTTRIILHHAEASSCDASVIHNWHKANGWAGIGYHFVVRKNGLIERGRPEWAVGTHASGSNSNSLGVCFEGAYMKETMPAAQKNAGKDLVAYLKRKYGITKVQRHSDVCATSCPGINFPFSEIAGASVSGTVTVSSAGQSAGQNSSSSWISRLQSECNRQGFSRQAVDGIAGRNTLAGCPMLSPGASGGITKLLQEKLISLGYSCGSSGADGILGQDTQRAVKAYQKDHGLAADGIVGPATWKKLLDL